MKDDVYAFLIDFGFTKEDCDYFQKENEKVFFTDVDQVISSIVFLKDKGLTDEDIMYVFRNNPFMITAKYIRLKELDKIYCDELFMFQDELHKLIIDNPKAYTQSPVELQKIIDYLKQEGYPLRTIKYYLLKHHNVICMTLDKFLEEYDRADIDCLNNLDRRIGKANADGFEYLDPDLNLFRFRYESIPKSYLSLAEDEEHLWLLYATLKNNIIYVPSYFEDEAGKRYNVYGTGSLGAAGTTIRHVKFEEGIEVLDTCFLNCGSILSVYIPKSVAWMKGLFYRCPTFEENDGGVIYYAGTEEQWEQLCNSDWTRGMTDYTPYKSVVRFVDEDTFAFPEIDYRTVYDENTGKETNYLRVCEAGGEFEIPSFFIDDKGHKKQITHIGRSAFMGNKNIKKVIIPSTIQEICTNAFYGCENLEEVIFMESDAKLKIGEQAFRKCTSLKSVIFSDSVTSIGMRAFSECTDLENITIPSSVKHIDHRAFAVCKKLNNITIPDSVEFLGEEIFANCEALESVCLPSSVGRVPRLAFAYCDNLKNIQLREGITVIEEGAFGFCSSLKYIHIPDSVKSIQEKAFHECAVLKSIHFPAGLEELGKGVFTKCDKLEHIVIPGSLKTMDMSVFQGCKGLKTAEIQEGVTKIETAMFYGCENLEEVSIPESVQSIGLYAFYGCNKLTVFTKTGSYAEVYEKKCIRFSEKTVFEYKESAVNRFGGYEVSIRFGDDGGTVIVTVTNGTETKKCSVNYIEEVLSVSKLDQIVNTLIHEFEELCDNTSKEYNKEVIYEGDTNMTREKFFETIATINSKIDDGGDKVTISCEELMEATVMLDENNVFWLADEYWDWVKTPLTLEKLKTIRYVDLREEENEDGTDFIVRLRFEGGSYIDYYRRDWNMLAYVKIKGFTENLDELRNTTFARGWIQQVLIQ